MLTPVIVTQIVVAMAVPVAVWVVVRRRVLSLPAEDQAGHTPRWTGPQLLALAVAAWLGGQVAAALVMGGVGGAAGTGGTGGEEHWRGRALAMLGAQGVSTVFAAWVLWLDGPLKREARRLCDLVSRGVVGGVLGTLLGAPFVLAVSILSVVVYRLIMGHDPDPVAHELLKVLSEHRGSPSFWMLIVSAGVGAPVAEELLHRGLLQPGMARLVGKPRGAWCAVAASSVVFALVHVAVVPWHAVPTLAALGLCLGVARQKTGGVIAPMVMHAAFNIANLAALLLA